MSENINLVCSQCQSVNQVPKLRLKEDACCSKCQTPLLTGQVVDLTASTYASFVGENDLPVVVNFWVSWCGHCRNFAAVFDDAAAQLHYQARLARVESEEEPDLIRQFAVKGMPTHIIFQSGREVARQSGAMPLPSFMSWLRPYL
ncbi:MAG: thioredoxin TrxC [Deltaproteobacteria bacterium]|nr:thioredoxin TrxC [Candidatus Tharpella sp.]